MGDFMDFVILVLFVLFMVFLVNGFVVQVGQRKAERERKKQEAIDKAKNKQDQNSLG